MVSTIDRPSSGEVKIGAKSYTMKSELAHFRRRQLGFVFQDFNLLDTLTVAENIVLPLTLDRRPLKDMESLLQQTASRLGIREILNKRVYEISGGQRQRTAIARAIISAPLLLLADEPTGALDSNSSRIVMESLAEINERDRTTLMLVTHDPLAASYCNRIVLLKTASWPPKFTAREPAGLFPKSSIRYRSGEGIQVSFPQFAFNNVRRNARQYFAYLLSGSFMVMIFLRMRYSSIIRPLRIRLWAR